MITAKEAEEIHKILISKFGGSNGIRDMGALKSASARPFQTFEKVDLYPNTLHKAAAIIESLLMNHPFVDGNKRTGYVLMRLYLINNGIDLLATQTEKYNFVISIASANIKLEEIVQWLSKHSSIK